MDMILGFLNLWEHIFLVSLVAPVFGEDVRRVGFTRDVEETEDTGSNGFTNSVEREGSVSFVEFGVGNSATVDDGLVVTKHVSVAHWDAHCNK